MEVSPTLIQKKDKGKYLWPGFSENLRVLKWIFDRCDQNENDLTNAIETPIGFLPKPGGANEPGMLDTSNLSDVYNVTPKTMEKLLNVDTKEWLNEVNKFDEFYSLFGERVPRELHRQLKSLRQRLTKSQQSQD